jgi:hypothetical protein
MYDIAEVTMNGTKAGYTWKTPYRVYVTGLLKTGSNQLVVRVASRWNRSGLGKGLLGPVTLGVSSILTGARHYQSDMAQKNRLSFSVRSTMGVIHIVFSRKDDYRIAIIDIKGRTLNEYTVNKASQFNISKNVYAPAVYIISVRRGGEFRQAKCVMVK